MCGKINQYKIGFPRRKYVIESFCHSVPFFRRFNGRNDCARAVSRVTQWCSLVLDVVRRSGMALSTKQLVVSKIIAEGEIGENSRLSPWANRVFYNLSLSLILLHSLLSLPLSIFLSVSLFSFHPFIHFRLYALSIYMFTG